MAFSLHGPAQLWPHPHLHPWSNPRISPVRHQLLSPDAVTQGTPLPCYKLLPQPELLLVLPMYALAILFCYPLRALCQNECYNGLTICAHPITSCAASTLEWAPRHRRANDTPSHLVRTKSSGRVITQMQSPQMERPIVVPHTNEAVPPMLAPELSVGSQKLLCNNDPEFKPLDT